MPANWAGGKRAMRILVLGGYGMIGSAICRELHRRGHALVALGRNVDAASRACPDYTWLARDLRDMGDRLSWQPLLTDIDAVVNAAGVLQDGAGDDVIAVQSHAMRALFAAMAAQGPRRMVQVSAVGADANAGTVFMASKAEADAALAASTLDWTILRPGLVFGPQAYGGTALLRALAAFPLVSPFRGLTGDLQTIGVDELARAVAECVEGRIPARRSYDLVEDHAAPTSERLKDLRRWLGLPPARLVAMPRLILRLACRLGDGLSWLGWRPPIRSTALAAIEAGVRGDPAAWRAASGGGFSSFADQLRQNPATVQERWFARMWLLKPAIIATLALFWLVSGLIGLMFRDQAMQVLTTRGFSSGLAGFLVVAGAAIDLALGTAVLVSRWARQAALGMVAVTLGYLAAATILTPDLWLDPLGPLVKTVPAALLALVAAAIAEAR